ncbi:hypothetical protein ABMA79_05440 [Halobacteriovorax sp. HFRX-2_2]|uniref:hypothetical protein n=1 Tax=unclassified Halobacteriovorax TaxID=2639665 RepID=UPI00370F8BF0
MKILIITIIHTLFSMAFACKVNSLNKELNITFSPFQSSKFIYNEKGSELKDGIKFDITDCATTVANDEYLMISLGVENNMFDDSVQTFSINDMNTINSKNTKYCRIEDKYNDNLSVSVDFLHKRLLNRRELISKCTELRITDHSKKGLNISLKQNGCIVNKINNQTAIFEGYFCFAKPHDDSKFVLDFSVKDECLKEEFYRERKIELQDVLATLDFYTSGDDSGSSPKLRFVEDYKLRFTATAEGIIKSEKTVLENDPKWPIEWHVNNIEMGKIKVSGHGNESIKLDSSVFINNTCQKTCVNGLCSSPCSYTQPVVGEYLLSEVKKDGEREFISLWYDGGITPSNWSGLLNGAGHLLPKSTFKDDAVYELEINLEDQEFYYLMFKNSITSRLKLNNKTIPQIDREAGALRSLNEFNSIELLQSLPEFPVFDYLRFTGNTHIAVKNSVNSISRVFKDFLWPPYIQRYCHNEKCIKTKDHQLTLKVQFKVSKNENKFKVEYLTYNKLSNVQGNKLIEAYEPPFSTCMKPGTDPNDDDDDWDDNGDIGDIDF